MLDIDRDVEAEGYRIIESFKKKTSLGSLVWVDIELTDLRRLIGALQERKASECIDERCDAWSFSPKLNFFAGFICLLNLCSLSLIGFRIRCKFLMRCTFSLRKSRFGGG